MSSDRIFQQHVARSLPGLGSRKPPLNCSALVGIGESVTLVFQNMRKFFLFGERTDTMGGVGILSLIAGGVALETRFALGQRFGRKTRRKALESLFLGRKWRLYTVLTNPRPSFERLREGFLTCLISMTEARSEAADVR
jgi:hypothetical protein